MLIRNFSLAAIIAMTASFAIATNSIANTCPTTLKQDEQGFWFSTEKPGWKSHIPTPTDVKIDPKNFGGVVYSPKRKRLACVYRASNNKWIALVSELHHSIQIDEKAKDDSGKAPAWQFSKKHNDYACGRPRVTELGKCQFTLGANSQVNSQTNGQQ